MSLDSFLAHYGLAELFVGAGWEGEAAAVTGGVLARHGWFPLAAAIATATTGSFVADQLWFFVGRRFGRAGFVRRAHERPAFARALAAFRRHPIPVIFAFRFVYGFRMVTPIALGTTDVSLRLFAAVNFASALTWGLTFSTIGYLFGHRLERLAARVLPHPRTLAIVAAAGALVIAAVVLIRRRRAA